MIAQGAGKETARTRKPCKGALEPTGDPGPSERVPTGLSPTNASQYLVGGHPRAVDALATAANVVRAQNHGGRAFGHAYILSAEAHSRS